MNGETRKKSKDIVISSTSAAPARVLEEAARPAEERSKKSALVLWIIVEKLLLGHGV